MAAASPSDAELEASILDLLARRAPGATICPSDVARALGPADGWRPLMDPVRDAAWRLVEAGEVEVTQGGRPVAREGLRGPVRIRRIPSPERPRGQ